MKSVFRKVASIFLVICFCLAAVPFPAINTAEAATLTSVPGPGTYDRYQDVKLYSSSSVADIVYSVGKRATDPSLSNGGYLYDPTKPVRIDEDVILSVNADDGSEVTHKEFSYTINPYILSTYPADGTENTSRNPKMTVNFSRKMDPSSLVASNIIITQLSPTVEDLTPTQDYTVTYYPSSYKLEINLEPGVTLDPGATYMVSLKNIKDSNGKSVMGNKGFTFSTTDDDSTTFGQVRTGKSSYGEGQDVNIYGAFFYGGSEVDGNVDLKVQIFDPDGVRMKEDPVTSVTYGRFNYTYTLPAGAEEGTWTVKLYDGSTPRQLLDSTTFTVVESTIKEPVADLEGKTYYEPITVNLSTTTPGAEIYYVIDYVKSTGSGAVPVNIPDDEVDSLCTKYTGPISISAEGKTRIRAVSIKGGVKSDDLLDETYTIIAELGWLNRTPDDGVDNVPLNSSIKVKFGRAVKSTSINSQTFRVRESSKTEYIAGQVSYNAEERTATFKPVSTLKADTSYTVILEGYTGAGDSLYIEDLNGVKLTSNVVWSFETGSEWISVDGRPVVNNYVTVNKNPVTVVVTSPDTLVVNLNKVQMVAIGTNQFTGEATLKPGNNTVTIEITDNSSNKTTVSVTVNYLNLLQVDASVTAAIPAKGKLELFDKQLTMNFPKGSYLKDSDGLPLEDQSIVFNVMRSAMPDGFPSVSYIFDIQPKTDDAELNNWGEASITLAYDKYVSATSTPSLTVLCDPDSDGVWEENLGGKVDAKKRTVTVPFGTFGRYVVVNKVWSFADYSNAGWARPYVEFLWSKGYMNPLPTASTGQFGLVDVQNNEIPITRGEFAVMMGKVLGLNKSNYMNYGIFADMRLYGNADPPYAMVKDLDGYWKNIDDDDYKYIDMLARNGIINGSMDEYGNLVFNYYRYISREEVAVILAKAMNLAVETDDTKVAAAIKKMYTDADTSIAAWSQPYVLAVSKGYFGGYPDKTFRGKDNFTRPQAARIVYMAMKKAKLM